MGEGRGIGGLQKNVYLCRRNIIFQITRVKTDYSNTEQIMKIYGAIVVLALVACSANVPCKVNESKSRLLSATDEKEYRSLISHIGDTNFEACACLAMDMYSSYVPNHRQGIGYALSVERKVDSSFSRCATISRNDSVFHYIEASDMARIQRLYKEWFELWKNDTTLTRRALDGTEYKWVDLRTAWRKDVIAE